MKATTLALALLIAAAPAFAADLTGKWTGSIESPNGPIAVTYRFKADKTRLTGLWITPDGTQIPIKDGKIEGNTISFAVELNFGPSPATFEYTGVVSSGEIRMRSEFMGEPLQFTLKKSG